jgi:hypothetical protein
MLICWCSRARCAEVVEKNIITMELSLRDIRTIAYLTEWRRIRLTAGRRTRRRLFKPQTVLLR